MPQAPLPAAMFPDGSSSHPQGAEDEGDDEHADAGKKQVQQTMHHDAQDAQRHGRDHQEENQDNHSTPRSGPRSPGSSVTSRTSTATALMPTGWPSMAGRESPSEDEPGGRSPPRQSSGADVGQRRRLHRPASDRL